MLYPLMRSGMLALAAAASLSLGSPAAADAQSTLKPKPTGNTGPFGRGRAFGQPPAGGPTGQVGPGSANPFGTPPAFNNSGPSGAFRRNKQPGVPSAASDAITSQFDANRNGRLDTNERKVMQQQLARMRARGGEANQAQFMSTFDLDGDGQLSDEESKAGKAAIAAAAGVANGSRRGAPNAGFQGGVPGGQPPAQGADNPEPKDAKDRKAADAALRAQFDVDGNGRLDSKERMEFNKAMRAKKAAEAKAKRKGADDEPPADGGEANPEQPAKKLDRAAAKS